MKDANEYMKDHIFELRRKIWIYGDHRSCTHNLSSLKKPEKKKWWDSESAQKRIEKLPTPLEIVHYSQCQGTGNDIFLFGHFVWLDVERAAQKCAAQKCAAQKCAYVSSGAETIINNIWQGTVQAWFFIQALISQLLKLCVCNCVDQS